MHGDEFVWDEFVGDELLGDESSGSRYLLTHSTVVKCVPMNVGDKKNKNQVYTCS